MVPDKGANDLHVVKPDEQVLVLTSLAMLVACYTIGHFSLLKTPVLEGLSKTHWFLHHPDPDYHVDYRGRGTGLRMDCKWRTRIRPKLR